MFGKTSVVTVDVETEQAEAKIEEVAEKVTDQDLLEKGHPSMRARYPYRVLSAMSEEEQGKVWDAYHSDLDAYHGAYLRTYGVECRDCTC